MGAPALDVEDPRLAPLVEACADVGGCALVGAPVRDHGGPEHIAMLVVDGAGARVAYHKMWLSPAEAERFTPGRAPAALEVGGWRLGLAVCRDTGIPRHASDTASLRIDAYVAGVLEHADDAAVPAERARRIATSHGVWVAMASFAGSTGGGYAPAPGRSGIWSPYGLAVALAGPEAGDIACATLRRPSIGSGPA
jgi:predicted amidohydrolase